MKKFGYILFLLVFVVISCEKAEISPNVKGKYDFVENRNGEIILDSENESITHPDDDEEEENDVVEGIVDADEDEDEDNIEREIVHPDDPDAEEEDSNKNN